MQGSHEELRNPTWFTAVDARKILAKGREVKYAKEIQAVVDRALEHLGFDGYVARPIEARSGRTVSPS